MGEFLTLTEHRTPAPFDQAIRETYIGQAHIAGTGPEGKTCRECVYWRLFGHRKKANGEYGRYVKTPAYWSAKKSKSPCELKKQRCTRPIANKASRLIPHHAKSCRLFEPADNPPPAIKGPVGAA